MKNDPKHYREMSKPFDTVEASNEALAAFFRDVEAARNRHRIAEVVVLCEIACIADGEEVRGSAMSTHGDSAKVIWMLAREYGAEQQRHQERLGTVMACARKAAKL